MAAFDFIAIDFETANHYLNSACSIGIAAVRDMEVVDVFHSLIRPTNLFFEEQNVKIHGITPDIVENAPIFDEVWGQISQYFSPHIPVVAHNAYFDMSVLRKSTAIDLPDFLYIDSMDIAAPLVGGRKGLNFCADTLGIQLEHHHDSSDDAYACAAIALCGLKSEDCVSMWEYLNFASHVHQYRFADLNPQETFGSRNAARQAKHWEHLKPSDFSATVSCINPANPLFGKHIVFTGEMSLSRSEAMQIAVNAGAVVKTSVSRKTNYLVVGIQDKTIVGDDGLSTKEEKAYALNEAGTAHIEIIDENTFLNLAGKESVV